MHLDFLYEFIFRYGLYAVFILVMLEGDITLLIGGVLAHSTHLRGIGAYDAATGIELPRINVTLATRIPEERCRKLGLGYLNPDDINFEDWRSREAEGILLVPKAGELLYRLRPSSNGDKK